MNSNKVEARTPSGFMELLPRDQLIFNWMFSKIKSVFELFGYLPIETPAVELKDVLFAKGGGEVQKQVYRLSSKTGETDMCLHFDLTVPLARYVVEHFDNLSFPFRRYQMQKVWRGERAQKGRYREFYQCDIDVIGTTNALTDAEIPSTIYQVFKELGVPKFTININNRKLICGIFETISKEGLTDQFLAIADKLEKVGEEITKVELLKLGIDLDNVNFLLRLLSFKGSYLDFQSKFKDWEFSNSQVREGLVELEQVYEGVLSFGVPASYCQINLGIVRGLDYYTGTVYETILDEFPNLGSVCSGGRYDNLCQYYTDRNLPGVGISIGLSRLFFQLKDAGILPGVKNFVSEVVVIPVDESSRERCMVVANSLRVSGIKCEVYLEKAKLKKQLKYADDLGAPYVMLIGESELSNNMVSLKNMKDPQSGNQEMMTLAEAIKIIGEDI